MGVCVFVPAQVRSFRRRILSFTLDPVPVGAGAAPGPAPALTAALAATAAAASAAEAGPAAAAAAVPAAAGPPGGEAGAGRPEAAHQVWALTVRGTAFLWHQVSRCYVLWCS
jgi:hypothetical protein